MKKVLATLLITTVGLTTLLANGISQGTNRNTITRPQYVGTTTTEDSTLNEITVNTNYRGSQYYKSNANSNISRNNNTECLYDGTGNMKNSTNRINSNKQNLNYSNKSKQSERRTNDSSRMGRYEKQSQYNDDCINPEGRELNERNYRNFQMNS